MCITCKTSGKLVCMQGSAREINAPRLGYKMFMHFFNFIFPFIYLFIYLFSYLFFGHVGWKLIHGRNFTRS